MTDTEGVTDKTLRARLNAGAVDRGGALGGLPVAQYLGCCAAIAADPAVSNEWLSATKLQDRVLTARSHGAAIETQGHCQKWLDKMASRSEAAHLQWGRRLHTKGVPSYADEPDR